VEKLGDEQRADFGLVVVLAARERADRLAGDGDVLLGGLEVG
jgi:hypothetical protein